jgi:hypothetical protein
MEISGLPHSRQSRKSLKGRRPTNLYAGRLIMINQVVERRRLGEKKSRPSGGGLQAKASSPKRQRLDYGVSHPAALIGGHRRPE